MKKIILKTVLTLGAIAALMPIGATAATGDLYVSDNNRIWKFTNGKPTVFADLSNPSGSRFYPRIRGLAFDSAGNLYASTLDTSAAFDSNARILKFASDGTYTLFASLPSEVASGIAFDQAGNLWVSGGFGSVYKITPNGAVSTFTQIGPVAADPLNPPASAVQLFAMAVDSANNPYVAATGALAIFKITACGAVFRAFNYIDFPNGDFIGLTFDNNGNLFASDAGTGTILQVATDGTQTKVADLSALDADLRGLAFDSKGNLFVVGHGTNALYEVTTKGAIVVFAANNDNPNISKETIIMPAPGFNVPQYLTFSPK